MDVEDQKQQVMRSASIRVPGPLETEEKKRWRDCCCDEPR